MCVYISILKFFLLKSNQKMGPQAQFYYNNVLSVGASSLPPTTVASSFHQNSVLFSCKSNSYCRGKYWLSRSDSNSRSSGGGESARRRMASSSPMKTSQPHHHLRHVESMKILPSGAGKISHLNAAILGESLASEENDLVFPNDQFSSQALVPSPEKVKPLMSRDSVEYLIVCVSVAWDVLKSSRAYTGLIWVFINCD